MPKNYAHLFDETGEIRKDILILISQIAEKIGQYPRPIATDKKEKLVFNDYINFSLKNCLAEYIPTNLQSFVESISRSICIVQNKMIRDFTWNIQKLKSYTSASQKELVKILSDLVDRREIGGFSKSKYDRHISDFKHQSESEIRQFLVKNYIENIIIRYENGNKVIPEILNLTEELYLKIWNIPIADWNPKEKKTNRMVEIREKFAQKNLIEMDSIGESFNYLSFYIKSFTIPEKILKYLRFCGTEIKLRSLSISISENQYELCTYSANLELTDELMDFFLDF